MANAKPQAKDVPSNEVSFSWERSLNGRMNKILLPRNEQELIQAGAAIGPAGYTFDDFMHKVLLRRTAWIGNSYFRTPQSAPHLLLVAESYYDNERNIPRDNPSRHLIQLIVSGAWRHAFYTKTKNIIVGHAQDLSEFWHSLVFYHYIQTPVKGGPRNRPTEAQWSGGVAPFRNVVAEAGPSHVIFLGKTLWRNVRAAGLIEESAAFEGRVKDVAPNPLAMAIAHPSSFGVNPSEWSARVSKFLNSRAA